jgi:hypothetical protein
MTKDHCPATEEWPCPWGVKPVVGMWAEGMNLFATDCILYRDCPRKDWTKDNWKENQLMKVIMP